MPKLTDEILIVCAHACVHTHHVIKPSCASDPKQWHRDRHVIWWCHMPVFLSFWIFPMSSVLTLNLFYWSKIKLCLLSQQLMLTSSSIARGRISCPNSINIMGFGLAWSCIDLVHDITQQLYFPFLQDMPFHESSHPAQDWCYHIFHSSTPLSYFP